MVEKENITICDDCKERIAEYKCKLCGKDLCKGCLKKVVLEVRGKYYDGSGDLGYKVIPYCVECRSKLEEKSPSNENLLEDEFMKKLSDEVVEHIRKKLILKNLKSGK